MNLTIRSHHTNVFPSFNEHTEQKLERLSRLLPRVDDVIVEVEHEATRSAAQRYSVQVTVHSGSAVLRAEERGADPMLALDAAADVLSRQARRHTERLHDRHDAAHIKETVADAVNGEPVPDEDE